MFVATDLDELTSRATALAAMNERDLSDHDVLATIRGIERVRRYLDAAEGSLLAEVDARGTTDHVDGFRTANWLARTCGVSPATARSRLDVAVACRTVLPATDTAVRSGRLCFDRARVLAGAVNDRIADQFAQLEPELIDMSATMTFDRWRRHVQTVAALLDQDGGYDPNTDVFNNHLTLTPDPEGTRISGTLVGDTALTVEQVITAVADELYRQHAQDRDACGDATPMPSQRTLRALALAEICRRAAGIATTDHGRVEATLVINLDTPDDVYDTDGLKRTGIDGLTCDMSIYTIVLNSLGVPLDMGREIRTANREQRRALARRDGGCVFPGCGAQPRHCDAHHVAHWTRDLGTTDVAHMVFLCRHHHGVVHRNGWNIHLGDDGWAWITTPNGNRRWCQRHGTQRCGPAPPTTT